MEQRQLDQQRAEQQQRELTQAVQQFKMENESLRQQKGNLQQSHDQLQSALVGTQSELAKISQYAEKVSADLIETNKGLAQKSELQLHWQIQHDKVYAKWEEQMKLIADLQSKNAVLSEKVSTMKIELSDIAEHNKVLSHDKWVLGQEKAQLFGQVKQLQATL